jgi:protein-L-isoaspartate(D-aspartate) O-methyltransferase
LDWIARIPHLARHGATNVDVVVGDGSEGLPEHAPYDAILVAAACPDVPSPLVAQLAEAAGSSSRSAAAVTRRSCCS